MNLYLRAFSIAIYQKCDLYYLRLFILFSGLQILQFWSVNYASYFRPYLWSVLILEIFSSWDVKKGQFQFLSTFLAGFFWSVNYTSGLCIIAYIEHGQCFI